MPSENPAHDAHDESVPQEHHVPRTGHWMSQDRRHHHEFVNRAMKHVKENPNEELHPAVHKFRQGIYEDSHLWMLFNTMFDEVPDNKKYLTDPTHRMARIRDLDQFARLVNHLIGVGPRWTHAGSQVGLVGVPINAVLDWSMGTRAGFAFYQDPKVNELGVLDAWGKFLTSPASAEILGDDAEGWFGQEGQGRLIEVATLGKKDKKFEEIFQCDPKAKHHGFKSWDDFFTRLFRDGVRPVASPEDDNVVCNVAESKPYKVVHNAHERAKFWLKGQPYSTIDMLAFDDLAHEFVGGTIYQAFLSALSYHRWHSPVSGTIKKVRLVPGTYYSEPLYEDFSANKEADLDGENTSQEYLSAVATRAIVWIQADNTKIGLMAVIAIGMVEVSTCDVTVKEGEKVKKGDQLGMFHFGGSTHAVLFRKGVKVTGFPHIGGKWNTPVRSELCRVE